MKGSHLALWFTLCSHLPAPLAAAAEGDPVQQAKELYEAGGEAYRQGRYTVAIGAFEEARRLAAHPAVTFSLAQAYRLQYFVDGDLAKLERAVELYRSYLAEAPDGGRRDHSVEHLSVLAPLLERRRIDFAASAPASQEAQPARLIVSSGTEGATARVDGGEPLPIPATFEVAPGPHRVVVEAPEHVTQELATAAVAGGPIALNVNLLPVPAAINVRAPEGATVLIDDRKRGTSPLGAPVEVPAGRHVVVVTERGHDPFIQQLEVGRGQAAAVDARLEVSDQRIAAYGLFGAAGVLLAGSGVMLGMALDRESSADRLEDELARDGLEPGQVEEYRDLESERDDLTVLAIGLGAASAGAAVTGLLLWIFDEPELPPGPVLTPGPAPAGLGALISW